MIAGVTQGTGCVIAAPLPYSQSLIRIVGGASSLILEVPEAQPEHRLRPHPKKLDRGAISQLAQNLSARDPQSQSSATTPGHS